MKSLPHVKENKKKFSAPQYEGLANKEAEKAIRNSPFMLSGADKKIMTANAQTNAKRRRSVGLPPIGARKRLNEVESLDAGAKVRSTSDSSFKANGSVTGPAGFASDNFGRGILTGNQPRKKIKRVN